ncbi:hypothetical protein D3C71_1631470 [compost metagenome]
MNAITALRRQPEKAALGIVKTHHHVAVGHERTQPGPHVRGPSDGQRGRRFDVIDAGRHVQLFGHHIVRGHRVRVGGRTQQLARIGLEIERLVNAHHGRPGAAIDPFRRGERESAAPARLQAHRRHAATVGHIVGPGARRVDDDARLQVRAVFEAQRPNFARVIA